VEFPFIIFGLVYDNCARTGGSREHDEAVISLSLFPCALASLGFLERDAMSLIPKFWCQMVILVDSPETPMLAVLSYLSWSHDTPLDVMITRRSFHNDVDGQPKRAQVVSTMNILASHIYRILELCVDVMLSFSLPYLLDDFCGSAPIMEYFELQCREDGGGRDCSELVAFDRMGRLPMSQTHIPCH
jgi:hypothetical protein